MGRVEGALEAVAARTGGHAVGGGGAAAGRQRDEVVQVGERSDAAVGAQPAEVVQRGQPVGQGQVGGQALDAARAR